METSLTDVRDESGKFSSITASKHLAHANYFQHEQNMMILRWKIIVRLPLCKENPLFSWEKINDDFLFSHREKYIRIFIITFSFFSRARDSSSPHVTEHNLNISQNKINFFIFLFWSQFCFSFSLHHNIPNLLQLPLLFPTLVKNRKVQSDRMSI